MNTSQVIRSDLRVGALSTILYADKRMSYFETAYIPKRGTIAVLRSYMETEQEAQDYHDGLLALGSEEIERLAERQTMALVDDVAGAA